jgi:hypothetical protein
VTILSCGLQEISMTRATSILFMIAALAMAAAAPAEAQVQCPPGFYYQPGYGCVPISDAYDDMYGNGYDYASPVYDGYGLAFGFGGGGHGGGRIGGGHASGGHAGGGHAGGGGHGGHR